MNRQPTDRLWNSPDAPHSLAELRDREELYRSLFEASPDAIFLAELGFLGNANQRALEMFGCRREDFEGQRPERFSPPLQPDGTPSAEKAAYWIERAASEGPQYFSWTHCRYDGTPFAAEVSLRVLELGGRKHMLAFVRDVSERVEAERQREALEAQLRQAQKMEAVGQLAGGVAHDFNNILTAILGHLELLVDDVARRAVTADQILENLREVESGARRAADLTRQLLTFSRHRVVELQTVDMNAIIAEVERMLRRLITENVELALEPGRGPLLVDADAGQIEQVIVNLVVNARDAMPDGGRVALKTARVELDAAAASLHGTAAPGRYVLLAVADTGCGMDRATRERIFEPFFTSKPLGQGTGLGLATVYGIVQQCGGFIEVDSALGQGTTFRIFLPEQAAAAAAGRGEIATAAGEPGGHETVLICEDDPVVRELVARLLTRAGYQVLVAEAPERALAMVRSEPDAVDLLVSDVIMPGMNGAQLARELRTLQPGLRTLFISGYTAHIIEHQGVLEDGSDLLEKPFTRAELLERVRALLAARPARG